MNAPRDDVAGPPPVSRLWWSVPAVVFVALVTIASVIGGAERKPLDETTFDTSPAGYRGLHLLLDELHYPVEQSRRVTGRGVRWLLAPKKGQAHDLAALHSWVRQGGRMLLAPTDGDLAGALGLSVDVTTGAAETAATSIPAVRQLALGTKQVKPPRGSHRVWATSGDEPLVTIHPVGEGEVWLLHRPLALANAQLKQGDNAVFACRLAEGMLDEERGPIAIDEFFHGLRDRPGVVELLWQPPTRYLTLQALLLGLLVIWRSAIRFGPLAPLPPPRRRSKEEFLDAYADLLQRQGDAAAAFRTVQQDLTRRLCIEMGLPEGARPEEVAREAARRRGVEPERVVRLLSAPEPAGGPRTSALLHSLKELEAAKRELLRNR